MVTIWLLTNRPTLAVNFYLALLNIVSKQLPLFLPLFIRPLKNNPEMSSAPLEYAASSAKLVHRLLIMHINNIYPCSVPIYSWVMQSCCSFLFCPRTQCSSFNVRCSKSASHRPAPSTFYIICSTHTVHRFLCRSH